MQNLHSELTSLRQKQGHMDETMTTKQKNLDRVAAKLQAHKQRNAELEEKVGCNYILIVWVIKHPLQ